MHPDRKIGIALGILLVGVVGALFFRNEPLPEGPSLSRQREEQLNQRLRDRDVSVYLDESTETTDGDEPVWTLEEALNRRRKTPPPQPIAVSIEPEVGSAEPTELPPEYAPPAMRPTVPQRSADFDGAVVGGNTEENGGVNTSPENSANRGNDDFEEYEVQFGDTLSGISQRFLGTSNRYHDIYNANQDRIDNPDRLKVGTALRIPRVIR